MRRPDIEEEWQDNEDDEDPVQHEHRRYLRRTAEGHGKTIYERECPWDSELPDPTDGGPRDYERHWGSGRFPWKFSEGQHLGPHR